jgi:hypothetical protein
MCQPPPPPSLPLLIHSKILTHPPKKVAKIKELVEEKEGIPPAQQRLIYGGKQMCVLTPSPPGTVTVLNKAQGRRQVGRRLQPRGRRHAASGVGAQGWGGAMS